VPRLLGSDEDEARSALLLELLGAPRPEAVGLWDAALHREYVRDALSEEMVTSRAPGALRVAASVASLDHRGLDEVLFESQPDRIRVLVPWNRQEFDALVREANESGITEDWLRRAAPLSVTADCPAPGDSIWKVLDPVSVNGDRSIQSGGDDQVGRSVWYILTDADAYHDQFGLAL